jgi:hypothetical protein
MAVSRAADGASGENSLSIDSPMVKPPALVKPKRKSTRTVRKPGV